MFEDEDNKIIIYDVLKQIIRAESEQLQIHPVNKKIQKGETVTNNSAWCAAGDFIVLQFEDRLLIKTLPYVSFN